MFFIPCVKKARMYAVGAQSYCLCSSDRAAQLERGDTVAQDLVNSLQVLEVMAGAMATELRPLVRLLIHQDYSSLFVFNIFIFWCHFY